MSECPSMKRTFASAAEAHAVARKVGGKRNRHELDVYHCDDCGAYHFRPINKPARQLRKMRRGAERR